jgi:hypothetical protein
MQYWRRLAEESNKREIMMFSLGVCTGLRYARDDHAADIANLLTASPYSARQ